MHYVYILFSESADKFYIGSTSNVEGRLIAHNHPDNKGWTKRHQPWTVVFSQSFPSQIEALAAERKIKSYKSKEMVKSIIKTK